MSEYDLSASETGSADLAVAEITDRLQAGESVDVDAYIAGCPEAAGRIRRLVPALRVMEALKPASADGGNQLGALTGTLGDYRILREVGRGGMGVVYEAEQISLGRRVALKVLPFAATMDPRQLQRFHNEARAAASLHHEPIVPVYAVGSERGVHYYAVQFIDGRTLAEVVETQRSSGGRPPEPTTAYSAGQAAPADETTPTARAKTEPMPRDAAHFRRVAEWGEQAAVALEHAHTMGIVHRDIKPANLMIDERGKLWVTDFGLARTAVDSNLTVSGDMLGTVRYMSPEQAQAKHGLVDHRTDVYALGATLYEVLTLRPAFCEDDRADLLRRIISEDPPGPRRLDRSIPVDLETIALEAMEKELSRRYATAQAMNDDLRRFLEHRPILARRPSVLDRASKWSRRHWGAVAAAFGALLLAVGVLGVAVFLVGRERDEKAEAIENREIALQDRDVALEQKGVALEAEKTSLAQTVTSLEDAKKQRSKAEAHLFAPMKVINAANSYTHILKRQGNFRAATALLSQSVDIQERLLESYPDKKDYRRDLLESCSQLAQINMNTCNFPAAIVALEKYLKYSKRLGGQAPSDDVWANLIGGVGYWRVIR